MKTILDNPKFATVVKHFVAACKASREHSALASQACDQYGDHGAFISGVVHSHFPVPIKDELRRLARLVTTESDAAYDSRPKRVRLDTIRTIGKLIVKRDGSGFYGPRG